VSAGDRPDQPSAATALAEAVRAVAAAESRRAALDILSERLRRLVGADGSAVALIESSGTGAVMAGPRLPVHELDVGQECEAIVMAAIAQRRPVWSADILDDPALGLSPEARAPAEAVRARAMLAVPLLAGDRPHGALAVWREHPAGFSAEQVEIARAFAELGTLALEHARLGEAESDRQREAEVLREVEREMLGELSPDRLFPLIGERAARLGSADGVIYVLEPGGPPVAPHLEQLDSPLRADRARGRGRWRVRRDQARRSRARLPRLAAGPSRLRRAGRAHSDAILLDLRMPGMAGLELPRHRQTEPGGGVRRLEDLELGHGRRELEHVVERAVIVSEGPELAMPDGLPRAQGAAGPVAVMTLEEAERAHIRGVLDATGWRVSGDGGAARLLGLPPTTLESRMKKLGITRTR
jgi:transcriptional regulator with GAF, ATPase, and Fis domain